MPAQTIIKLRRGTASQWDTADPILAPGEVGLETDTNRTKYGDGATAWTSLPYSVADASGVSSVDWVAVLNKPTEFTPEAHTHTLGEITDYEEPVTTVLSDTEPGSPVEGLRWLKTTTMQQYIYFDSVWVEI